MPAEEPIRKFTIRGKHPDGRQAHHVFRGSERDAEALKLVLEENGFEVEMTEENARSTPDG
jgi:hypothetical protein